MEAAKLGIDQDKLIKGLNSGEHDHNTATYYLLLKKQHRNELQSIANLNSDMPIIAGVKHM